MTATRPKDPTSRLVVAGVAAIIAALPAPAHPTLDLPALEAAALDSTESGHAAMEQPAPVVTAPVVTAPEVTAPEITEQGSTAGGSLASAARSSGTTSPPVAPRGRRGDQEPGLQERPVKRVLHLRGGAVLRGPSRRDPSGRWSVRGGSGWRTLPDGAVLSAVDERDALRQLEALEEDPVRAPAELVDGALELGLFPEACERCDALLELHPRDLDLRGAAERAARHLAGLPERGASDELEELMRLGALESLLMREAVVRRLVSAADRSVLEERLRAGLRSKRPSERAFAAFATGRLFPNGDPRPLLLHAVYDPAERAREAAARAIGDAGAYEVGGPLVRALEARSGPVRLRVVEALGASRDPAFVEPLVARLYTLSALPPSGGSQRPPRSHLFVGTQRAYVQDFDVEVAQGSSVADPVVNTLVEGVVLDVSVIGVQEVHTRTELRSIRAALGRITGRKPGSSNRAWRTWWESDAALPYRPAPEREVDTPPSSHGEASGRREDAKAPL